MASDLDDLLNALEKLIGHLLDTRRPSQDSKKDGLEVNMSLRVGYIDELLAGRAQVEVPPEKEPLIDAFEDEKSIRVVVLLPGVRKEDVTVIPGPGLIKVEVVKGETVYAKEIPCRSAPSEVRVVSAVENNSVVELVFKKEGSSPR
jgi:HSP20 family molecular chaperone IbpA